MSSSCYTQHAKNACNTVRVALRDGGQGGICPFPHVSFYIQYYVLLKESFCCTMSAEKEASAAPHICGSHR